MGPLLLHQLDPTFFDQPSSVNKSTSIRDLKLLVISKKLSIMPSILQTACSTADVMLSPIIYYQNGREINWDETQYPTLRLASLELIFIIVRVSIVSRVYHRGTTRPANRLSLASYHYLTRHAFIEFTYRTYDLSLTVRFNNILDFARARSVPTFLRTSPMIDKVHLQKYAQ